VRNKILIVGGIAFLAYILGSRATRIRAVKTESVGHQLVRLWNEPKAKNARKRTAKTLADASPKNTEHAAKAIRGRTHDLKKNPR
jgi:hypothetical protein